MGDKQGSYHRKANLATMNYIPRKQGAISDLDYSAFHKEILPGLTYIKLYSPPPFIIESIQKKFGIWIQRDSKIDYRSQIQIDTDNFLKFPIPDDISKKVREWSIQARDANSQIRILLREEKAQ